MKISVITPSYNQAPYLERTLRSIHAQQGGFELEHIVIDGGSTDGSVEILERWKDRLWYVSEPDRGQSHALNKGVARATGEVIAWLNSDDLLLPGALQKVAAHFESRPDCRWMYGRCKIINERDQEIRRMITWYKNRLMGRFSYTRLLLENYISQPSTFFRKELCDAVGGVDEQLVYDMDYDLFLRFGLLCPPHVVSDYLACFRLYSACKTGGSFEAALRSASQVSRKYAARVGKPWAGAVNYWLYSRRTLLIYRLLRWANL